MVIIITVILLLIIIIIIIVILLLIIIILIIQVLIDVRTTSTGKVNFRSLALSTCAEVYDCFGLETQTYFKLSFSISLHINSINQFTYYCLLIYICNP